MADLGWDFDEFIHPSMVESEAQFKADVEAETAQHARRQAAQRGRNSSAATGSRRRAVSEPGGRQSRRQRREPAPRPSAAGTAGNSGNANTSSAAARMRAAVDQIHEQEAQARFEAFFDEFVASMQAESDSMQQELAAAAAADAAGAAANRRTKWGERCEEEERRWRTRAPSIGAAMLQLHAAPDPAVLCSSCQAEGCTIRCFSCCPAAGAVFLCDACDKQEHTHLHMHRRQEYSDSCWNDMPRADPDNGFFLFKPTECNKCHSSSINDTIVKTQALDYITIGGVIKAKRAAYECGNAECKAAVWQQPEQFVSVGAWPASLDDEHLRTIIAQDVLDHYDTLKLRAPTVSLSAFVNALADAFWHNNLQQPWRSISTGAFRRAADEYSSCQLDLRLGVKQLNDLSCPACSAGNCAFHIDSNMKLFVWQRRRQQWRLPHFREFIADSADVQLTIQATDVARTGVAASSSSTAAAAAAERDDRTCNGVWAAAGDGQQRRLSKQAVTGRCVATDARHGLPKMAVNLVDSGERYAYALHLLVYHLQQCKQLHIDIMCKWGPWLQRTLTALLQDPPADASAALRSRILELRQLVTDANNLAGVRKVLSHAHGTLHSLNCQVLWQPGWTEDCAKALGEEGEQFFSYFSKYAFTTRNQSIAGADDQLTKGAFHFARCKLRRQAAMLVARRRKFSKLLPLAEARLAEQLQLLVDTPTAERPSLVSSLREALRAHARDELDKPRDGNKKLLEQYSEAVRVRDAQQLSASLNSSLASIGMQSESMAAVRVMAGLTDSSVAALHGMVEDLCRSAQESSVAAAQADAIIKDKFVPALDASILRLQNVMEGLCHDLKKSESKRDAKAATPKERQRHSKKCKEVISTLAQRVQQYNVLVEEYNKTLPADAAQQQPPQPVDGAAPLWGQQRSSVTLDDVRKQQFSWVNEYAFDQGHPLRLYGVARAMAVCEADNEVARIREELGLLPLEMQAHVRFYRTLEGKLSRLQTVLAADSAPTLEGLQAAGYAVLPGAGRYQPTDDVLSSTAVRSGAITFVRLAQVEVQQLLHVAVKAFADAGMDIEDAPEQHDSESVGEADSEDGDLAAPSDDIDGV